MSGFLKEENVKEKKHFVSYDAMILSFKKSQINYLDLYCVYCVTRALPIATCPFICIKPIEKVRTQTSRNYTLTTCMYIRVCRVTVWISPPLRPLRRAVYSHVYTTIYAQLCKD